MSELFREAFPRVAAPRGGFTYYRRTRSDIQRARRHDRKLTIRVARRARRLTRRLWLSPHRWRAAWFAHHDRWCERHGC